LSTHNFQLNNLAKITRYRKTLFKLTNVEFSPQENCFLENLTKIHL